MACLQLLDVPWVWQLGDCIPLELTNTSDGVVLGLAAVYSGAIRGVYSVVSQRVIDEINAGGVALNGRVELIPNWVTGDRPVLRTRFYAGGRLKILAAGRVNLEKGFDILIEAVGLAHAAGHDDVVLDIFGEVRDPYFHSLIRNLGLTDHVRLMGTCPQSELLRLYGEYDVVAFPTQPREPFGLVPLEAASRGCVPIMSQSCGIAEWLVHGVHCLKTARRPDAFATVFRRIMSGSIRLEPIARRAAEATWRDFHIDTILPRMETMLHDASIGRRGSAGNPAEVDRMARIAEHLAQSLITGGSNVLF
jgi:glycosyltransferase involved in cell wall biosynthesis